jgi:hypothetical protein
LPNPSFSSFCTLSYVDTEKGINEINGKLKTGLQVQEKKSVSYVFSDDIAIIA